MPHRTSSSRPHAIRGPRAVLLSVAGLLAAAAAPHAAALTLYDDFSGVGLSPFRWVGGESSQAGAGNLETRRALASGMVRVEAKTYSDNNHSTGMGHGESHLTFVRSADINDVRATITMRTAAVNACPENSAVSSVSARVEGEFFNAGGNLAGSRFNDVVAGVMLFRLSNSADGTGVLRAAGYYGLCNDETCSTTTQVDAVNLDTTGLVNTAAVVEIRWDAANHRFVFQKDGGTLATLTYALTDTRPAQNAGKRLQITNDVANCASVKTYVYGGADFDNVYTNALP
jgi:hypothetical protein